MKEIDWEKEDAISKEYVRKCAKLDEQIKAERRKNKETTLEQVEKVNAFIKENKLDYYELEIVEDNKK